MQENVPADVSTVPPPSHITIKNPAANPRRMRRLIAEDPEWNLAIVPQLTELCIQHIINNFENNPILERLLPDHQKKVLEKISTSLPLTVTANLISDEGYWKRCCTGRWTVCDVSAYGDSWKRMFFERHLENILKFYIPDTTSPNKVLDLIPLCKEYVKKLEIDQFLPPVKVDQKKEDEDVSDTESDAGIDEPSMDHFDLSLLVPALLHLEELHLSYGVKDCGMNFEWNLFEFTYRDCCSLASAIKKCPTLKVFKLTRSKVDDDKARILILHLLDHPSLVELNLSHNLIADRGARAIGKLINRSKMVTLNICDNRIRAQGAQAIAHALSKNSILTSLDFRLNCIEDEGGQAICHALLLNSTLMTLHLGGNELSEPTATLFSQVLAQNTTLSHINLSCNHIGLDGGKQLLEGMSDNKTVVEFDLRLAEVGQESEYLINQTIKANQELARLRNLHHSTT
ncbi:dynein regulatory complex subunit 5 [Pantherophis guttatus]|uniref:Dynein regulatory complex subunit 5 n=1 Tax=Pantherophis guttatus TaxID=94885 RepID=A0A6P9CHU6_PANGU|nr:dynein regulatory complex subunit 5 [Pantherophis guttatus]XP_034283943.1 dynein regulatory complex subunit 5 [Pantherophis guttatus]XP_034283944.1 dynein regulatory complex subunit 5 [Pantherophis guttatus]XP_060548425.1 dynein regulatory complex subunit 5 [Pantherophis guttatus]